MMAHTGTATKNLQGSDELWIAPKLQVFPLSHYQFRVREPLMGVELVLEGAALGALQLCSSFRSLEQHAQKISRALNGEYAPEQVSELLVQLERAGLLWSSSSVAKRMRSGAVQPNLLPDGGDPQDIVIRTCGRPAALERLLLSAASQDREHGMRRRYWVVDDSDGQDQRAATRSVVNGAGEVLEVAYWGSSEQQQLVDELSRRLPEYAPVLRWLLSPAWEHEDVTPGRSLNHALLLTTGRPLMLLDDDAILEPHLFNRPEQGMRITSGPPAARSLAVALPGAVQAAPMRVPLDAIAVHGQVLGKNLGTIFRDQTRGRDKLEREAVESLDAESLSELGPGNRVLISTNSVLGDPGSADSSWIFLLGDEVLQRQMTLSTEALETVTTRRDFWRGDDRLTVVNNRTLMFTTCTGLDNREFLPPVPPARRNEDTLFGALTRLLHPDALTVNMHWALPHRPERTRQWDRALLDRSRSVGANRLLASIANQIRDTTPEGDRETRNGMFVQRLRALAGAHTKELRDYLAREHIEARANVVRLLNEQLAAHPDAPDFWVQDVHRLISANSLPLGDTSRLAGKILGERDVDAAQSEKELRELFSNYASALEIWPKVRDQATALVSEIRAQPN